MRWSVFASILGFVLHAKDPTSCQKLSLDKPSILSQTLFRKSNQLAKEIAGASQQRPEAAPDREIVHADVLHMLQAARSQIAFVKTELGIEDEFPMPKLERKRTPSDVMREIIEAGNTLNQLVDEGADWSNIYDRVLQMIAYMGGVLPEGQRYPALAPHACCKMPHDVYASLSGSLEALSPLAESLDFSMVKIIVKKSSEGGGNVDTVYDLTTIMISDIGEITLRLNVDDDTDYPTYERPKRILPSDVYLLAKVLEQQVKAIKTQR